MKKVAICLLLLCATVAVAQQWQSVANVVVFQQNQAIPQTTLLTPTTPGLYRVTVYFSTNAMGGNSPGYFNESVTMQDISGQLDNFNIPVACTGNPRFEYTTIPIGLAPNVPVTFALSASGTPGPCVYSMSIIVEQFK